MGKLNTGLLVVIAILIIVVVLLSSAKQPEPIITTVTEIDTLHVTHRIRTQVEREKVITEYDTVYVDARPYVIASYRDRIDTTKVSIDLDIKYYEYEKLFDVKAGIDADIDTVYITKTITNTEIVTVKPKPVAIIAGVSPMFIRKDDKTEVRNFGVEAGLRFGGKYDITLRGNTDEAFGLGLTIRF